MKEDHDVESNRNDDETTDTPQKRKHVIRNCLLIKPRVNIRRQLSSESSSNTDEPLPFAEDEPLPFAVISAGSQIEDLRVSRLPITTTARPKLNNPAPPPPPPPPSNT
uniref:Uncharacterized protein LOC111102341 isoform X2 n=1 Tax=Crassostrea virginica TaxID=6565 RepID=A0A8B8AHE3_CRAVI|nr:uncharacterized protein LOC111102341 isoform X2 [Crassostrea virginica]